MLTAIRNEANKTYTENGALTLATTNSRCLDFFSKAGALRGENKHRIINMFNNAWAENRLDALKILFFLRDIRGGLGERETFRTVIRSLTPQQMESIQKNYGLFAEMGRYDDLFALMGTKCEESMLAFVKQQFDADVKALAEEKGNVSLLGKWMPSINATKPETICKAKRLCQYLGMSYKEYRKTLAALRQRIQIVENNLRVMDYSFDYGKQSSRAMLKYRKAFLRNDKERYSAYISSVAKGDSVLHTETLFPYDIVQKCISGYRAANLSKEEIDVLDATWKSLPVFSANENTLAVIDGSGSMYGGPSVKPIAVAESLGIYFAEHCKGEFHNHFITFSESPQLVEVKGNDIVEKVIFCMGYNEVANTNIQAVFDLLLNAAIKNRIPKEEMVGKLYIISDMEFDCACSKNDKTNFEEAKAKFEEAGYQLPTIIFWNVASRNNQVPVKMDERGVILVSGFSPVLFKQVTGENVSPYSFMREILDSKRYEQVAV